MPRLDIAGISDVPRVPSVVSSACFATVMPAGEYYSEKMTTVASPADIPEATRDEAGYCRHVLLAVYRVADDAGADRPPVLNR